MGVFCSNTVKLEPSNKAFLGLKLIFPIDISKLISEELKIFLYARETLSFISNICSLILFIGL